MVLKKGKYLVLAAGLTLLLSGCGKSADMPGNYYDGVAATSAGVNYEDSYTDEPYMESTNGSDGWGEGEDSTVNNEVSSDRKLIRTVNLSVETKTYDELMATVDRMVKDLGGYIESMESSNGSIYSNYKVSRSASMTLRIPKKNVDEFLGFVEGNANILHRNESVEDVTLNYTDLESRKQALKVEYDRLLAILEKADQLEDIIMLEDRLSNVRYEMENLEKSLRRYDDKVDYSTVYLNISEVEELTPVVVEEKSVTQQMKEGFLSSVEEIKDGLIDFAIDFVTSAPYLVILVIVFVIWIVVILVLIKIILAVIKKKTGKTKVDKSKQQDKKEEKKEENKEN